LLRDQIAELKSGVSGPVAALPSRRKLSYPKPSRKKRG
jgi:hypothetical protein